MADVKLIIKIPEEMRERIKDGYVPLGISKYLQNGTPIPDNATVEDVINIVTNKALPIEADNCGIFMSIPTTWLKRPYQKGGKDEV